MFTVIPLERLFHNFLFLGLRIKYENYLKYVCVSLLTGFPKKYSLNTQLIRNYNFIL